MGAGKGLRKLRKERGLSISKAAELAGVSPNNLCDIENEKQSPYLKTILEVARANNLDLHRLAHYSFGIEGLEGFGEIDFQSRQLIQLFKNMNESEQNELMRFAKWLMQERGTDIDERARNSPNRM